MRILTCSALTLLLACATPEGGAPAPDEAAVDPGTERSWREAFDDAAATWDVPVELLQAIALAETGMQMVHGEEEFEGRPVAHGVMGLRGDRLVDGAELAGLPLEEATFDRAGNVLAAAAWLSWRADELGVDRADLGAWAPAVADLSGIEHPEARAAWVHDEVFARLRDGFEVEGLRVKGDPALEAALPRPVVAHVAPAQRSYAVWRASPNYNSRPSGSAGTIGMVIIHSCEGSYSGCWSWLVNPSSGVSAHYVVNESGSEVSQLVMESNRAWHVGATYDCNLNSGTDCWRSGRGVNDFSVGIEHGGYAAQSSWSTGLLATSAQLTCDITRDHGIPRDAFHIVAHGQLQPYNRTDPGRNWPWTDYLNRVNAACGGGTPPTPPPSGGAVVIDSNNAANDTSSHYIEVSASWTSSQNVSGYYNTGYWAAPTAPVSDGANFWFYLDADACLDVDAWWTSAFDRARAAPWIAYDATGAEVGRVSTDQSVNGARWNDLGDWVFRAGWNRVYLSRWTTSGYYVIADALRLTPDSDCAGWCGVDTDGDGTADCTDQCPADPAKTAPGTCGCGVSDADTDGDGTADCLDQCPADPAKTAPGACGCGVPDDDNDGDGVADCTICGDGLLEVPEQCDDGGAVSGDGCSSTCRLEALLLDPASPGTAGVPNTLTARGAAPSGEVFFLAATRFGTTAVPGCPGVTAPVANPTLLGASPADATGVARLTGLVPASYAGRGYVLLAVEPASCRVSEVQLEQF